MSADEYGAIFRAAPDAILVVGPRGFVRDANPATEAMFGYSRDELVGREVEVLVPEAVREAHVGHRTLYTSSPHARPMGIGMELKGRHRTGREFPVEISLSPWEENGESRIIAIIRDVSGRKRLREFGTGALRATEAERQRIARELHDDTAQHLAALLLRLRLVERGEDDPRRRESLEDLRSELAACADGVRRIARGLRPPELEDAGVVAALRAHVRGLRSSTGLEVELDVDPVDEALDPDAKLALYRVVQEALSNVVRHSGADRATVRVWLADGRVVGEVLDRGRGFSETRVGDDGGGLGLVGMHERAMMVGGDVRVRSEEGRGTTVTIELPARGR